MNFNEILSKAAQAANQGVAVDWRQTVQWLQQAHAAEMSEMVAQHRKVLEVYESYMGEDDAAQAQAEVLSLERS